MLLQNGDRFGRQHVIYQSKRAYPAYVVTYRMLPGSAATTTPVVKVMSSMRCISVTVGDDCVHKANPQASEPAFVLVTINIKTLKAGHVMLFNINNASGAKSMMKFIAALEKDDIVAVAATNLSIPSKWSPCVVDVLRSLRSIGGSVHVLDCPYVLVGAKYPCLLNGLVHEDHQSGKAAVAVDMRVIRHNRDTVAINVQGSNNRGGDDMVPVRWQRQSKRNTHATRWQDLRLWASRLTAAYKAGQLQVVIDGRTVDLVKMEVQGFKIRCLNWRGETLGQTPPCLPPPCRFWSSNTWPPAW